VSFGQFAVTHGCPAALAIVMSAVVFSGSAQFALVTTLGGGLVPGLAAASLMNLRFLPMAAAAAPHLTGGRLRRAVEGQMVVDGSWVAARQPDGTFDRSTMFAATLMQWPAWVCGTALGALARPDPALLHRTGLDLVFLGFFAVLLYDAVADTPGLLPVALAGGALAAAACRILPTGVALLIAAAAALLAVRWRAAT
jgi:predicted branched-subunit amino acid permease